MSDRGSALLESLRVVSSGASLSEDLVAAAFGEIMRGEGVQSQIAGLLVGLRARGETVEEIAGVVRALRAAMIAVSVPEGMVPVDTAGTGGGSVSTFNISTAAALVAVGAGVPVAKHGNRSHTSRCGSADVLEALGVPIASTAAGAERQLRDADIAFLFAPTFHPAMRFVAPTRRELAVPTMMNLVGPLANPAGVERQIVGVADAVHGRTLADVLGRLGATHAMVVHGRAGLDEVSPSGPTAVWEWRGDEVREWTMTPEDLAVTPMDDLFRLAGADPADNAQRIERLFDEPDEDPAGSTAVILNAGLAIYVGGVADSPKAGVEAARESLTTGAARTALGRLRRSRVA